MQYHSQVVKKHRLQQQSLIPLKEQLQTWCFRFLAVVTTGVPSPISTRFSKVIRPFCTEALRNSSLYVLKIEA